MKHLLQSLLSLPVDDWQSQGAGSAYRFQTETERTERHQQKKTTEHSDVSKIKGKLAKRPPKGVGAAKKEKAAKEKNAKDSKKPKKVQCCEL